MANFSAPTTGNLYTDVVGLINAKIGDLALMLDPAVSTPTNVPTNALRWNSTANRFEKWNGSAWNAASTLYAISIGGNSATATTLQTARAINGTSFNGGSDITTANWGTARVLTVGNTGKSVNGSAAVSWSLAEIGISTPMQAVVAAASLGAGRDAFGVPHADGTNANGTWSISISGTAANCSRTVTAAGLASGGGTLTSNLSITVPKSDQALAEAGVDDSTAMTPLRTAQAIAAQAPQPVVILASWPIAAGGTTLDITGLPSTGYRCFRITGRVRQATMSAGGSLNLRWSRDNGATFVSTATYNFTRTMVDGEVNTTPTLSGAANATSMFLHSWVDYGSWAASIFFDFYVYPAETTYDRNVVRGHFYLNRSVIDAQQLFCEFYGIDQNLAVSINALRLYTSGAGGSFTDGEYTVYGYKG